ncbi:TetR/AcrR family transcriptional regulator [Nocardioides dongkuii]|uniref:TetR/AcrR family transcriptional regulator n=1 Tax=Nocardioides dongkuii TaxID=2760089 RepID=UPI0015FB97F1|nr:TetR/AcrR family transcriptional regulator [Nocardioides dongkuii]
MPDGQTPRQLARAANIERIKELALRQLASEGATSLSLRAIARELNLVSSAIYRYYPSRDELITALILDAYADLADALEAAGGTRRSPRRRWADTCDGLRAWAVAQPHRFALVYGSAIPGYAAPADTIAPAARVVRALAAPVVDGAPAPRPGLPRPLRRQLDAVTAELDLPLEQAGTLRLVGAFARLVGLLTLELNGHFVGGFEPADALYAALVEDEADALGL